MSISINDLINKVDTKSLMSKPLTSWRNLLAEDVNVYVFGENYIAKRFDAINYKFCEKDEAKEILVDNLYALLRYKYFKEINDDVDDYIKSVVTSFTMNLKTTLKKASLDNSSDSQIVKMIPDYCVAFRNGVYDFKNDKWLFKYEILKLENLSNNIYLYSSEYIILWYMNYDFEPLPINLSNTTLDEMIEIFKVLDKENKNYCFELLYNMSHNKRHIFSEDMFKHLCEIFGYTILQSFSQYFVLLVGYGQNGKNSLFDGCFSNRIVPMPASNDMESIENDRFITGALQNRYHNIFLETSAKIHTESKMIKALTGSMYQTIESKGVSKYSGFINCKYLFAGNDKDKIKFSDTTTGFRRRINMIELYYQWDSNKRFLKQGDYYDTTFSDSLKELKDDVMNTTLYIYLGMYGILSATKGFTQNFKFTYNDWKDDYSDIDLDLKEMINNITPINFAKYVKSNSSTYDEGKTFFFDDKKIRLYSSDKLRLLGYNSYDKMLEMFEDEEASINFFSDNTIFVSIKLLQSLCRTYISSLQFTTQFKKMFNIQQFEFSYGNKPYVRCTFTNGKLVILK